MQVVRLVVGQRVSIKHMYIIIGNNDKLWRRKEQY